jgi:hypothetical protein
MGIGRIGAIVLAASLLLGATAARADEEVFNSINGADLVELLQAQGIAASLTQDSYGDPLIVAEVGNLAFSIITYNCNGAADPACARLQLAAQFRLPGGASETDIAMMNAYNQQYLFGRAYIDPYGSATVDYTINLNQGVTEDNLVDNLNIWIHVLDNFVTGLGWSVST